MNEEIIKLEISDYYIGHQSPDEYSYSPKDSNSTQSLELINSIIKTAVDQGLNPVKQSSKSIKKGVLHYDGGVSYDIFSIVSIVFGSSGLLLAYLKIIKPLLEKWLSNRNGRSVKVKFKDKEFVFKGLKDFNEAIEFINEMNSLEERKRKK